MASLLVDFMSQSKNFKSHHSFLLIFFLETAGLSVKIVTLVGMVFLKMYWQRKFSREETGKYNEIKLKKKKYP